MIPPPPFAHNLRLAIIDPDNEIFAKAIDAVLNHNLYLAYFTFLNNPSSIQGDIFHDVQSTRLEGQVERKKLDPDRKWLGREI